MLNPTESNGVVRQHRARRARASGIVMKTTDRPSARCFRRPIGRCLSAALVASLGATSLVAQHGHGTKAWGPRTWTRHAPPPCRRSSIVPWPFSTTSGTRARSPAPGDPEGGSGLRHGLLGRGHDLQPSVLGCAIAGGPVGGLGAGTERARRRVPEQSRAHVSSRDSRALQGWRRRAEAGPRRGLPRADGHDPREVSRR